MKVTIEKIANGYLVSINEYMPIFFPELEECIGHLQERFPARAAARYNPIKDPEPEALQLDLEAYINQNKKE